MADELLIKINADAKNAEKAFDDIRAKTEDLEGQLKTAALISGAAFAALTAEVYLATHAFEDAQKSSVELSNALQNQGIYTDDLKKSYDEYAKSVQAATGFDDDAVTKAQAVAQTFLGQTKITEELTFAIADLGASMGGDLNAAAEKIGRTIGTGTNAFARQGVVISQTATEAERAAKVLEFVQAKAGGLAAELNKADGYSKALTTSFGNFQEQIGKRFEPAVAAIRQAFIVFFDEFTKHPVLADFTAALITVTAIIAGTVAAVATISAAMLALEPAIAFVAATINISFGGVLVIIGAVVALITVLALNWNTAMASIIAISKASVSLISDLFSGVGKVIQGAFTLDVAKIKEGYLQVANAQQKSADVARDTFKQVTADQEEASAKQNAKKEAAAAKAAAIEQSHQENLRLIHKNGVDLINLQNENASAALITLKQKEIETLKAIDASQSNDEIIALKERLSTIRGIEQTQAEEDAERKKSFGELQLEAANELKDQGININDALRADEIAKIRESEQVKEDIDKQIAADTLNRKIQTNNQLLLETKKYGAAYATLNKFLGSEEVKGAREAAGALVELQNSKNSTLKAIGKTAAVAQIGIDTPVAAMAAFRGLNTAIPLLAPAIGFAGAAAVTAYGFEKIANVIAAQSGGLIEGGIPGRDSVPALLEPGELVVPRKNFNDVVGSIQGSGQSQDNSELLAALQSIDSKISTSQTTVIQGDVHTDDSYVDALVRKISDAVQYRNGQIFGVTS